MRIMITGGAGFIGSAVIRYLLDAGEHDVVNVDKLTYAANLASLGHAANDARYAFEKVDICDFDTLSDVLSHHQPDAVMHLAAESHVDRSIDGPAAFVQTNIVGTYNLLEAARTYWSSLSLSKRDAFRFHHISTDEVYGALVSDDPPFTPIHPYDPRSPYSASKAGSDHLVRAWGHTYGLPVLISNCSNNYGPYQFPEKLIPLMIINALEDRALPVYGRGKNQRDWLHVEDHALALNCILENGVPGETYLIGGDACISNINVVNQICAILDKLQPRANGTPHSELISFVEDRPAHDFRYAIDFSGTTAELGWSPSIGWEEGLRQTVQWYLENRSWWNPIRERRYSGERLGLNTSTERTGRAG